NLAVGDPFVVDLDAAFDLVARVDDDLLYVGDVSGDLGEAVAIRAVDGLLRVASERAGVDAHGRARVAEVRAPSNASRRESAGVRPRARSDSSHRCRRARSSRPDSCRDIAGDTPRRSRTRAHRRSRS